MHACRDGTSHPQGAVSSHVRAGLCTTVASSATNLSGRFRSPMTSVPLCASPPGRAVEQQGPLFLLHGRIAPQSPEK